MLATSEHRESLSVIFARCNPRGSGNKHFGNKKCERESGEDLTGTNVVDAVLKIKQPAAFFGVLHFWGLRPRLVLAAGHEQAAMAGPTHQIPLFIGSRREPGENWPGGHDVQLGRVGRIMSKSRRWTKMGHEEMKSKPQRKRQLTSGISICARETSLED